MNRSFKEYAFTGRNFPATSEHRRGHSLTGTAANENLDLFSRRRRSVSLASSDESDVSQKLGKISVESAKVAKNGGLDDLLASVDGGKHDYDWLLTPPETPLCASSEGSEFQTTSAAPRKSSVGRSVSTTKSSRLSTTSSENGLSSRPARSSSVTRSSVSSVQNSAYSYNRSSSILNTSSASVSSYIRPSSPVTRSSSTARSSTPSSRSTSSRSSTPSKPRSVSSSMTSIDKTRPSLSSRPSTPSSRPQIPANLSHHTTRSNSRPSTPTRRNPVTTPSPTTGQVVSNGRSHTSGSRPSSPSPRVRPQQPVIPPNFPLDTPPNLRTTLPDRPISAGRSRPSAAATTKLNVDNLGSVNLPRRPSSPVLSRGRSAEPQGRGAQHSNGHSADLSEPRRSTYVSESLARKPVKASISTESVGFGRTISKKSLDMAIRHMDIRNGSGTMRPLPSTTLFPQSIRSSSSKIQPIHGSATPTSTDSNGRMSHSSASSTIENGYYTNGFVENGKKEEKTRLFGRVSEEDIYESSRYDAILLKEDLKNTTWLHSVDQSDQASIFDGGFEPLPEPFGLS